jgi:DNA-binding HxlR family transcriptional regulator
MEQKSKSRWYEDACGTALALEFVGERWSLLIMRELMLGPRRFSELRATLGGISANILTQRLESLERIGILHRRKLPPPASVQVYELTAWGYESEPIFQEMGRWATRSPLHDPMLPLSPVSAMLSLRTMLKRDRGHGRMTLAFRFPGDSFVGHLSEKELKIERGETDAADVTFECDPTSFVRMIYGKWPIEDAEAEGVARVTGDRARARRFIDLFALPPKITAPQ